VYRSTTSSMCCVWRQRCSSGLTCTSVGAGVLLYFMSTSSTGFWCRPVPCVSPGGLQQSSYGALQVSLLVFFVHGISVSYGGHNSVCVLYSLQPGVLFFQGEPHCATHVVGRSAGGRGCIMFWPPCVTRARRLAIPSLPFTLALSRACATSIGH
jgi:hypothetical protein